MVSENGGFLWLYFRCIPPLFSSVVFCMFLVLYVLVTHFEKSWLIKPDRKEKGIPIGMPNFIFSWGRYCFRLSGGTDRALIHSLPELKVLFSFSFFAFNVWIFVDPSTLPQNSGTISSQPEMICPHSNWICPQSEMISGQSYSFTLYGLFYGSLDVCRPRCIQVLRPSI